MSFQRHPPPQNPRVGNANLKFEKSTPFITLMSSENGFKWAWRGCLNIGVGVGVGVGVDMGLV